MTAATACNGAQISGSSSIAHQQSHQIHSKRFDATLAKTTYSLKLFFIYRRADESILEKQNPYDEGQGWIRTEDGVLEPVWSCGAALIFWTLGIVTMKKRRRTKSRTDEFNF